MRGDPAKIAEMRATPWLSLNDEDKAAASCLGFIQSSWEATDAQTRPGTKTWSVLNEEERKAAARLGFGETEWDDLCPTTGGTRLVRSPIHIRHTQSHGLCSICWSDPCFWHA